MNTQKVRTKPVNWKDLYSSAAAPLWAPEPHAYTRHAVEIIQNGTALDIGCGEGYDAWYTAQHGIRTTAIDIATGELSSLSKRAAEQGLPLQTHESDVSGHISLNMTYDIILSYGFLHFAGKNSYKPYIQTLKEHTNTGGIHAFYTFGNVGNFHDIGKHKYWFPSQESIQELYSDWKIIKLEEKTIQTLVKGDNGEPLYNSLIKILVKNSSST